MAQWIWTCLLMQGTWFSPWSGKIPHATEQLCHKSPCSKVLERQLLKCAGRTTRVPQQEEYYGACSDFPLMAPHSSTLAWKIPWMEEPGRLQSMGLLRVGHDWVTSLSLFTFMHWRRKWQPTPMFLPGESQGRGSLVACRLWGHTQSDTTEVT